MLIIFNGYIKGLVVQDPKDNFGEYNFTGEMLHMDTHIHMHTYTWA